MATKSTEGNNPESTDAPKGKYTLKQFLESVVPGRAIRLEPSSFPKSEAITTSLPHYTAPVASFPELSLYCGDPQCDRQQNFAFIGSSLGLHNNWYGFVLIRQPQQDLFVNYRCRNCSSTSKTFGLRLSYDKDGPADRVSGYKLGEVPQFGPPLPAKLLQLAGDKVELLKKGRRSENQSLGIGAFAYYRRVVESQKSRLIDELRNAVERLGGSEKALVDLEAARAETQFSKALELMADVTPKELFVNGQNPLRLLHGPLSVGLHGLSDEECLNKAHSIRIVLAAMLERVQMVTEEKAELDAAIKDLLSPRDTNSS